MNYIISEETKNEAALLVSDKIMTCEAPDRPLYEELLESLHNLTPIQSGEVVTKKDIQSVILKHGSAVGSDTLAGHIYDLQLHKPTPQPEALSVDLIKPTVDRYRNLTGTLDDVLVEQFGKDAWADNEDATDVDYSHAEGFYLGWVSFIHLNPAVDLSKIQRWDQDHDMMARKKEGAWVRFSDLARLQQSPQGIDADRYNRELDEAESLLRRIRSDPMIVPKVQWVWDTDAFLARINKVVDHKKAWTSGGQIAEAAKDKFEEISHKGLDWRSFYNGFLEGATANSSVETKLDDEKGDLRSVRPDVLADNERKEHGNMQGLSQDDREKLVRLYVASGGKDKAMIDNIRGGLS